jgi:hypothetical protein
MYHLGDSLYAIIIRDPKKPRFDPTGEFSQLILENFVCIRFNETSLSHQQVRGTKVTRCLTRILLGQRHDVLINPRPGNDFLAMYAGNWVVKSPPPETFFDISVEVQLILLLFDAFNAKI